MKKSTLTIHEALRRPVYFLMALAMVVGSSTGVVLAAASGGQVQERAIKVSDNGASGSSITSGVGSGTNVTYRVTFTASSSYTIRGVVLDFCSNSGTPFIGDSNCPAPAGFSVGATPTVDTSAYTDNSTSTPVAYGALGTTGDWTTGSLYSNQTFYMSQSTGVSVTAGNKYSFAISGITNPSAIGTYYARLVTFTGASDPSAYTHGFSTAYQDYGGFALSTADIVQVTAKVQENITFCVSGYSAAAGAPTTPGTGVAPSNCGDSTPPAIILGHGSNNTLDTSQTDINDIWTITSTNALTGVTIRMRNNHTCGGLSVDAGATCGIPAASSGAATPGAITPGTAAFGMYCNDSPNGIGVGSIVCDTNYNDGVSSSNYGMDTLSSGDNVTTLYGDRVSYSSAPVNAIPNKYTFAATASPTTPAGIYTANLAMIATGTF